MKARMTLDVEYDPSMTDPEGLATALDRLLKTALSTPDILWRSAGKAGPPRHAIWAHPWFLRYPLGEAV